MPMKSRAGSRVHKCKKKRGHIHDLTIVADDDYCGALKKSCIWCVQEKRGCGGGSPCVQCENRGRSSECVYELRKKSGPKKRGNSATKPIMYRPLVQNATPILQIETPSLVPDDSSAPSTDISFHEILDSKEMKVSSFYGSSLNCGEIDFSMNASSNEDTISSCQPILEKSYEVDFFNESEFDFDAVLMTSDLIESVEFFNLQIYQPPITDTSVMIECDTYSDRNYLPYSNPVLTLNNVKKFGNQCSAMSDICENSSDMGSKYELVVPSITRQRSLVSATDKLDDNDRLACDFYGCSTLNDFI